MTPSKNVKYQMIEKYLPGLKIYGDGAYSEGKAHVRGAVVDASDLEKELQKGVRQTRIGPGYVWDINTEIPSEHTEECLTIGIQEIKPQKVKREEILVAIGWTDIRRRTDEVDKLIKRILEIGVE
jgi:NAD(P)-dependent dehydrogenase (short-subunit alcohol dehydrogenase family)